jgi:hypothetical protein
MRPARPSALAVTVTLLLAARGASAQTAARCAPTIELGASLPPRVAQRLRRVLDGAVDGLRPTAPCAPSRARLEWNDHELTVRIAIDDGRIAVRNLESLEDVLPTLLSVLAVPAPDPRATPDPPADAAPTPDAPTDAPTDAPADAPAVAPTDAPAEPPAAEVVPAAVPRPPVAPPAARVASGWSLLVSLHGGAAAQEGGGGVLRWGGEVGAATPRFALTARATMGYALDRNSDRPDVADPNPDPNPRSRARGPSESAVVLSARARLGAGRLRFEVGGFGGVLHEAADSPVTWAPRFGLEAAVHWQLTLSLAAFARAEGFLDVGGDRGPGVALTLGGTWEPMR